MPLAARFVRLVRRALREEGGQDLIEYALLASFVAMASFVALQILGPTVAGFYVGLNALFASF